MNNSGLWAIHNSLKSWTFYNLTLQEVRLLVLVLSENEMRLVRICQPGDSQWSGLSREAFPQFFQPETITTYKNSAHYPELSLSSESVADTSYFVIRPTKVVHPRLHKRYEIQIPCVLIGAQEREFVTETVDLSEGGLYLKDVIPSWVAGYFLVVVNGQHQLMCSLVEDQKEKRRVQIVSEDSDYHYTQYKEWIKTFEN